VLRAVEHATGERVVYDDKSKTEQSPTDLGDILVWHNKVTDEHGEDLGRSAGSCILSGGPVSECTWAFHLGGGSITTQGTFDDEAEWSTLAVTGGTGKFEGLTGVLRTGGLETPAGEPAQYWLEFRFQDDDEDDDDSSSSSSSSSSRRK